MDTRLATLQDYDSVDHLLKEMGAERVVNHDLYTNMMQNQDCAVIVVETEGHVVGMGVVNIVAKLDREECRIDEIVVLQSHRGKGLGKVLFKACEDWAWSRPTVDRIEFTSRPSRKEAHELYHKLGYDVRETVVFCKKRGEK